ncbi:MAG: HipA domain-containing protein, partial [Mariprofundaceae bacterium]|nr:HipA domain-containing protein [Mariprofundaceae bacterium]
SDLIRRKLHMVTSNDYPELAESVIAGDIPGSSAGGEQPKFTAYSSEQSAHVIVKFSPKGNNPVARRWKDILITEYHAAQTLLEVEFAAAETRLIEKGGRLFLESHRFDRSGQYGRMSMLSLQNIDAEFTGLGEGWVPVVLALHKKGLVSAQHVKEVFFLWSFGRFINNSDMHLGNLSFGIDGDVFRLLPTYDMCSMGFAPKAGEVPSFQFSLPSLENLNFDSGDLLNSKDLAGVFWKKVASDTRISSEFKAFLTDSDLLTGHGER